MGRHGRASGGGAVQSVAGAVDRVPLPERVVAQSRGDGVVDQFNLVQPHLAHARGGEIVGDVF